MPILVVAMLAAPLANAGSNAIYDSTCALCHQNGATGLKGQFPRLAGRVDRMAAQPESRAYLIDTVLFGLSGKIEVDGAPIIGVMPPFASRSDEELAGVLNYLIHLGAGASKKVKPVTAAEIRAARAGPQLTPAQVAANRAALTAMGRIP
jgi:mono/diheme cytochrome c family protein